MQRKLQLDGIRWFLFMMVFTLHHAPQKYEFFNYALPMFFVISGFLISGILFKIDREALSAGLKKFFVRRTLRVFPAYYALILVLWLSGTLSHPFSNATYTVNLNFFFSSIGPDAQQFEQWFGENWINKATHLWSLSVEEQFYLIYPFLILLTPARLRIQVLATIVGISIVSRIYFRHFYPESFYGAFISPWEYFAAGGFFAWMQHNGTLSKYNPSRPFVISTVLMIALVAIEFKQGYSGWFQFRTTHFQTPMALLLGVFVWSLWNLPSSNKAVQFLSWRPFVLLGEMSYALYLWHLTSWSIFHYLDERMPLPNMYVSTLVITLAFGFASRYLVENPALRLKSHFEYKQNRKLQAQA